MLNGSVYARSGPTGQKHMKPEPAARSVEAERKAKTSEFEEKDQHESDSRRCLFDIRPVLLRYLLADSNENVPDPMLLNIFHLHVQVIPVHLNTGHRHRLG